MNIIVAHPFQQHSFKTAAAVKNNGYLYKYVTTVYLKKGSLTYWVSRILKGENLKRVSGRKSDLLLDSEVKLIGEWANLVLLLLQRIDKSKCIYNWWYWKTIDIFNNKLFKYIKKNNIDAIIVYDTVSSSLIKKIKESHLKIKVIIDMSAPNANYMKFIYEKEAENNNRYLNNDLNKYKNDYFFKKCIASKIELINADAFLVASNFTKKSLLWSEIPEEKIYKCQYGIYYGKKESCMKYKKIQKIVCSFLGKVCLEKGAFRLFNVINKLNRTDYEFHFYGAYDENSEYYKLFNRKCYFHGHIPHEQMLYELEKSDIIIFPSFADGFGFSVSEALARNNIALCSKNAGVSEVIREGINGYIFSPDDEDTLLNVLETMNFNEMRNMQNKAPDSIQEFTWENYEIQIRNAMTSIMKDYS